MDNIYYRGYEGKYGVFNSNNNESFTWLTDNINYALWYSNKYSKGKIAKIQLNTNKLLNLEGQNFPDDTDPIDADDETIKKFVYSKGYDGIIFSAPEGNYKIVAVRKSKCLILDTNVDTKNIKDIWNEELDKQNDEEIYYRGYNGSFGPLDNNNSYIWLTDDYDYAHEYIEDKANGKIAKVILLTDKIGSAFDLPEDVDYLDPGDDMMEELYSHGTYGYGFEAGENDSYCICIKKDKVKVIDADYKSDKVDEEKTNDITTFNTIEDTIKHSENFKVSKTPTDTGFILPDGLFVNTSDDNINGWHVDLEDFLSEKGLADDDFASKSWDKNDSGQGAPSIERFGAIRISEGEDYICLPPIRPTEAAYNSLLQWLDKYIKDCSEYLPVINRLQVTNYRGNQYQEYEIKTTTADEILAKIKRYYTTGKLVESLTKIITVPTLTENPTTSNNINENYDFDYLSKSNKNKIDESISYKNNFPLALTDKLIDWIEHNLKTSQEATSGSSYILPDGKFLTANGLTLYGSRFIDTHSDIQTYIKRHCPFIDEILDFYSNHNSNNNLHILDLCNCIRVSDWDHYITLPFEKPTELQYDALLKYLDHIKGSKNITIELIPLNILHSSKDIDLNINTISDDVVKIIKRYYTTGQLIESLTKIITVPTLTENQKQTIINYIESQHKVYDFFNGDAMYLTPDGKFIDMGQSHIQGNEDIIDCLGNMGLIKDDNTSDVIGLEENFAENTLGLIHCGNYSFKYIGLPKNDITEKQYKALDSIEQYADGYGHKSIAIEIYTNRIPSINLYYNDDTDTYQDRYDRKVDLKAIIRRYYKSRKLSMPENLKENNESDQTDNLGKPLTKEQVAFFKDSKVRNKEGKLIHMYHGTVVKFDSFNRPINWFSVSNAYSKGFSGIAKIIKTEEVIYDVYLNCKNILFCGNTSVPCYGLIPIRPYKLSAELTALMHKLGITEDDIRPLLEQAEKGTEEGKELMTKLYMLTNLPDFAKLVISKGYDSIYTIEEGHGCIGVFNPNDIKSVDNLKPTNSNKINEKLELKEETDIVDSLGNILSPEQINYFKDSKIRDKNGNLLVCYHGTEKANFDEFNPVGKRTGNYKYKKDIVNFFTASKDMAYSYSGTHDDVDVTKKEDKAGIYNVYLNIKHPYIFDANNTIWKGLHNKDIRKEQLDAYKSFLNNWSFKRTQLIKPNIIKLNNELRKFNYELRKDKGSDNDYDYELFSTSEGGYWEPANKRSSIEYGLSTIDNLLSSDAWKEDIVGDETIDDEDNYYLSTNDIVSYILKKNKEAGTYIFDGLIIKNVIDNGQYGWGGASDIYITIESPNQIKAISNKKPSTSNKINEDTDFDYGTGEVKDDNIFDTRQLGGFSDYEIAIPGNKYYQYAIDEKNIKGEIVQMTPQEYYEACASKIFPNSSVSSLKQQRGIYDKNEIEKLKKVITEKHKQFPMCFINYADIGQEGLHRMYVAGELFGWNHKFPVLIIDWADKARHEQDEKDKETRKIQYYIEVALDSVLRMKGFESLDEFKEELSIALDRQFDEDNKPFKFIVEGDTIKVTVDGVTVERLYSSINFNSKIKESVDIYHSIKDAVYKYLYVSKEPKAGSCYLMPNGDFLFCNKNTLLGTHADHANVVANQSGLNVEAVDAYICGHSIELNTDKYECRVDFVFKPTDKQYEHLLDWLYFTYQTLNNKEVEIQNNINDVYTRYNFKDTLPEDIIKDIKLFFATKENLNESSDEEWKKNLLSCVYLWFKNNISDTPNNKVIRCFIMPDGKYIATGDSPDYNHYILEKYIRDVFFYGVIDGEILPDYSDFAFKQLNLTNEQIKDIQTHLDMNNKWDGGSITLEKTLGAIRCNGGSERYIVISDSPMTTQQYQSLGTWFDVFYSGKSSFDSRIDVCTRGKDGGFGNGNEQIRYHYDETTGDDIIKKIKRYYVSGILLESQEDKIYRIPEEQKQLISDTFKKAGYSFEYRIVDSDKLTKDNDLDNPDNLGSYHTEIWGTDPSKYQYDVSKDYTGKTIYSGPYAHEKFGKIILGDGKHRTKAKINAGYTKIEIPVITNK